MSLLQTTHAPTPSIGAEVRAAGIYVLAGMLVLLLQTTLLHGLSGGRIIPDLVLILCVYLGLYEHNLGGVPTLVNHHSQAGNIIRLGAMVEEYRNSTEPWVESKTESLLTLAER